MYSSSLLTIIPRLFLVIISSGFAFFELTIGVPADKDSRKVFERPSYSEVFIKNFF